MGKQYEDMTTDYLVDDTSWRALEQLLSTIDDRQEGYAGATDWLRDLRQGYDMRLDRHKSEDDNFGNGQT